MKSCSNLQGAPRGVEDTRVVAHEDDAVSVSGGSDNHLDAGAGGLPAGDLDLVSDAEQGVGIGSLPEEGNAGIPGLTGGVGCEAADDDCHADLLAAGTDDGDRQSGRAVARDEASVEVHVNWSEKMGKADWSPMAGRRVLEHREAA